MSPPAGRSARVRCGARPRGLYRWTSHRRAVAIEAPASAPVVRSLPAFPYDFDAKRRERARSYERGSRLLSILGGTAFPLGAALLFWVTGGSRRLADIAEGFAGSSRSLADALYIVLFALLFAVVTLPVGFYAGHVREKKWAMSNRRAKDFAWEAVKGIAFAIVFALFLLVPFFYVVRRFAEWWAVVAVLYAGYLLFSTSVLPNLLLPFFYKIEPLGDEALRATLVDVAERAQFKPISSVVVMRESAKSPRANAFIHGLGRTRRIVLYDTLLRDFHPREVRFIVAHETAHLVHRDVPKFLAIALAVVFPEMWLLSNVLGSWGMLFGTRGAGDAAVLPLLLAFVVAFGFVDRIAFSWISRRSEAAADAFALRATQDPAAAESMMKRLCDLNLIDDAPHPWLERLLYSHPAPHARIEAARRFGRLPSPGQGPSAEGSAP